jgi:NitT/TauT family transport system substrate-binding protein
VPPDEGVVSNVVAHPGWIGCAESGVLIAARARGQPIKVVGTMLQGTPICLMSLAKSAIRTPADLAGRRIGLHADGNDAIDYVLARNGLDRSRLRIEILPHDTTPLTEGRLDAVQGYAVDEAVELSLEGHALHLMFFHDHGYAAYAQAYFVSEQTLATRPETVRKFLAASRRGWIAATGERDAAVEYIATRTLPGSDRRHQRKALDAIVPLLTREGGPGSHGKMRKETWQAAVAAHNALPGAARKVSVGELVVFDP